MVRVPLHSRNNRGFPLFLANKFAGNSKMQLLYTLIHQDIFELEEIQKVLDVAELQSKY